MEIFTLWNTNPHSNLTLTLTLTFEKSPLFHTLGPQLCPKTLFSSLSQLWTSSSPSKVEIFTPWKANPNANPDFWKSPPIPHSGAQLFPKSFFITFPTLDIIWSRSAGSRYDSLGSMWAAKNWVHAGCRDLEKPRSWETGHRNHKRAFRPCCWLVPGLNWSHVTRSRSFFLDLFLAFLFNLGASSSSWTTSDVVHRRAAERLRWWLWHCTLFWAGHERVRFQLWRISLSLSLSLSLSPALSPHVHTPFPSSITGEKDGRVRADWMRASAEKFAKEFRWLEDARK